MKTFKGSYFEIGKQQGQIYKSNGLNLKSVRVNREILSGQLKVYNKRYPQLLEELEGIAVGGSFDKEKILQIYLAGEILWYTGRFKMPLSCTIFGVKNKNGVFVGRNLDWIPATEEVMEVYKREGDKCFNFIGLSDMLIGSPQDIKHKFLFYDTIDVINEKGLFIGITFAYGNTWSYGLSWRDISKLIAETCSNVDEALKVFEKVPLSVPKNFFIADKNGKMVVIEHNSNKYKVLHPKDGVLIQTNHYVNPELAEVDRVLKEVPHHNTYIRYYEALQKVNWKKDKFKHTDVINVLANPQSYICQNHEIKTIWSLALDMLGGNYWLYTDVVGKKKKRVLEI